MLSDEMAESIASRVQDPNAWNIEARRIAERLGLNVTRIAFHPVILYTCMSIVDEAQKQRRTEEQIRAAFG